jgi:Peptidase family M28
MPNACGAKMLDEHHSRRQAHPAQSIFLLIGILALVGIGLLHSSPPVPSPLFAPSTVFSSTRAMSHVRQIGQKPHPTGSHGNAEVRQYLLAQLKALGLAPEIQSAIAVNPQKKHAGRIHNVLVRILGTKPGKALLLSAHYDSVHTGPGAADDGASVAAILETLRAIKTLPPLQNDLICIFTDSEENGLLGSSAFVRQHPWAKDVGLALNFEYRGNRGAFMMFETSQGNGKLIEGLAQAAPFLSATSLMYEVYKRLDNDSDLSIFKQAGIPGMNFAAIEGHTHYHSQLDRPEFLDQGTLQQEGNIMLALVNHFGNIPLNDLKSTDRIYFDAPGLGLVNYPTGWVVFLNITLLLLFTAAITAGLRREIFRVSGVIAGSAAFMSILMGLSVSSHFLWSGIRQLHPEYESFFQGDTYNSQWYLLAFVFLNMGLFGLLHVCVCKWLRPIEFSFGVMACWLVLSMVTGAWLPGVSFLFFWPLAAILVVVGTLINLRKNVQQPIATMLIFLGSVPGLLIFTPFISNLFVGLTPQMIGVVVIFLVLLLGLLTPLMESMGQQKWLIRSSLLLGFAALLMGSLTSGFDVDHPRQNTLFYALDSKGQSAYWLSTDKQLDQWTSTYFPKAQAKQAVSALMGSGYPAMWVAQAPLLTLPPPTLETLEDSVIKGNPANKRKLTLRVKSARMAPKLKVTIEGCAVLSSTVAGQPYTKFAEAHWRFDSVGLNEEALDIEIIVNAGNTFAIRVVDVSYGLHADGQNSRPSSMISKPSEFGDSTLVINSFPI